MKLSSAQRKFFENVLISRNPELAIPLFLKESTSGNFIKMAGIHTQWQRFISKHRKVLIVAPRDHAKTQQVAVGRMCYEIGMNPNIRATIFSESNEISVLRVDAVKNYIVSPEYQNLYPDVKPSKHNWGTEQFTVQRDYVVTEPTLKAKGITSASTGYRSDLIILDDVCGEECQSSGALRKTINRKFDNTVMNLLEPESRIIVIGTTWHTDDLTSRIAKEADINGFAVLWMPINDNLDPIWEEKWSRERLIERRNEIGIRAFDMGYKLKALSEEDKIFNDEDISACIRIGDPVQAESIDNSWIRVMGVDLAISEKTQADFTCIFLWAVNPHDNVWIPLQIIRKKMKSPDVTREIIRLQNEWNCHLIMVENNQYQESVVQWTKEYSIEKANRIIPIEGLPSTIGKIQKASIMSVDFEHRNIRIYTHQNPLLPRTTPCTCGFCVWIKELSEFPNSQHDDTLDGQFFARYAITKLTQRDIPKPRFSTIKVKL